MRLWCCRGTGRRLALVAEAKTYGKKLVYSGPLLDSVKFEGAEAKVAFKPGTAEGLATTDNGSVKYFAIADEDKHFVWADAKIINPSAAQASVGGKKSNASAKSKGGAEPASVLTCAQVPKPVAVRYAWANNPDVNLVNAAGLPAVPFRTDNWPQNELKAAAPVAPHAPTPAASAAPPHSANTAAPVSAPAAQPK